MSFLLFAYVILAVQSLTMFDCVELSGRLSLRAFVQIECFEAEWYRYLFTSILGILLYTIGIPALLYYELVKHQFGAGPRAVDVLGYQVMSYREGYRWWDLVILAWRLFVLVILRLMGSVPIAQLVLFLTLLCGRIILQRVCNPYVKPLNNRHDTTLMTLTLVVAVSGVTFFAGGEQAMGAPVTKLLLAICFVGISGMFLVIGLAMVTVYREERHRKTTEEFETEFEVMRAEAGGDDAYTQLVDDHHCTEPTTSLPTAPISGTGLSSAFVKST